VRAVDTALTTILVLEARCARWVEQRQHRLMPLVDLEMPRAESENWSLCSELSWPTLVVREVERGAGYCEDAAFDNAGAIFRQAPRTSTHAAWS
jgi:hypothetical protein